MMRHDPSLSVEALAELASATERLRGYQPVATRDAREDVWARLESRAPLRRWLERGLPVAAVAAAVLLFLTLGPWLRAAPEATAPGRGRVLVETDGIVLEDGSRVVPGSVLITRERAEIESARVRLVTGPDTRLRLLDVPAEPPLLEVLSGTVEVELAPAELTQLFVQGARVRLLGARVRIEAGATSTKLTALGSELRVEVRGKTEPLAPNQELVLRSKPATVAEGATPGPQRLAPDPKPSETQGPPPSPKPVVRAATAPATDAPRDPPPSTPSAPGSSAEARLDQAHRVVASDATRAEALAREVLESAPAPKTEARALAILADARRRNGAKAEAAALYRQVAEHESGAPYAEEALYQAARLLFEMKRAPEALRVLTDADARFSRGPLAPERHVLAAELHLSQGARAEAQAMLARAKQLAEAAGDSASAARISARLEALRTER